MSMGITAENVATRYKITREMQDKFAYRLTDEGCRAAQKHGKFKEIVPVEAVRFKEKGGIMMKETFIQDSDDGVRSDTTVEGLGKAQGRILSHGLGHGRQLLPDH